MTSPPIDVSTNVDTFTTLIAAHADRRAAYYAHAGSLHAAIDRLGDALLYAEAVATLRAAADAAYAAHYAATAAEDAATRALLRAEASTAAFLADERGPR